MWPRWILLQRPEWKATQIILSTTIKEIRQKSNQRILIRSVQTTPLTELPLDASNVNNRLHILIPRKQYVQVQKNSSTSPMWATIIFWAMARLWALTNKMKRTLSFTVRALLSNAHLKLLSLLIEKAALSAKIQSPFIISRQENVKPVHEEHNFPMTKKYVWDFSILPTLTQKVKAKWLEPVISESLTSRLIKINFDDKIHIKTVTPLNLMEH